MDIKNVGQLRKVIENLSDDYTIETVSYTHLDVYKRQAILYLII